VTLFESLHPALHDLARFVPVNLKHFLNIRPGPEHIRDAAITQIV
jgi:hypothetical protein